MQPNGRVHLKTDNRSFFDYTLWLLRRWNIETEACTFDLYASALADVVLGIKTTYENRYLRLGLPIHYLAFRFAPHSEPLPLSEEGLENPKKELVKTYK